MKIVQQPFCCWRDVLAALRNGGNVVVRAPQRSYVFMNPRKKRNAFAPAGRGLYALGLRQASAVFFKPLRAKKLGAYQRLGLTRMGRKNFFCVRTEKAKLIGDPGVHALKPKR